MFQHIGKAAYKADLNNTIALLGALGNPQNDFKTIHVAGTNGKGSVSSALAAVFTQHGYKTGLYTSPHLKDFRERIRIDGIKVEESFVVSFTEQIKPAIEQINPSFFELTVAMAFTWFKQKKVDMAIIETGMGGRLDSTNVILPVLSIITNIGLDHTEFLGPDRKAIASEKAGIIKLNTPIVLGESDDEIDAVFQAVAKDRNAPLVKAPCAPPQYWIDVFALKGNYQKRNLATLYAAIGVLQQSGFPFESNTISEALINVRELSGLRGRWEILGQQPMIIADCAHNEHGLRPVMQQISELRYRRLHIVLGMVSDKNHDSILSLMPEKADYYFCKPNVIRGLDAQELKNKAAVFHLNGYAYGSVKEALQHAKVAAQKDDVIYIGGSTFVVAEALPG